MWEPCVTRTMWLIPAGWSSASVRLAFSRVSRDSLSSHLIGRPNSSAAILPATLASLVVEPVWAQPGAAAERDRRAGLAGEPEAVAQPLERRVAQTADAVFGSERLDLAAEDDDRERLLVRSLGAQLACAVEAERGRCRQQELRQSPGGAGAGREPEQDDADRGSPTSPGRAAAGAEGGRAASTARSGPTASGRRGDHRLPGLDAVRRQETVHVRVTSAESGGAIVPEQLAAPASAVQVLCDAVCRRRRKRFKARAARAATAPSRR